jgi:WD40 repeat protein
LKEFGQTPEQLFFKPHPQKYSNKIQEIQITTEDKIIKNEKNIIKEKLEENIVRNEINEKDISLDNNNEIKDKVEEKGQINEEKQQEKNEINFNIMNKSFKPFKIKSDIDLKLNKKYKSVQKYDDISAITGTILPESNLILTGNTEGQLNIYYYYSGEISKQFSLFHEIKNINPVDKKTIIYSSDYSINTFDVELGKNIWAFYAHDTNINSLFFDEKYQNIISSTKNGIIHVWDYKHKSSIPFISHFLFDETNIISSDFNKEIKFFYSLGEKGDINILNIFEDEEIYKWKLDKNESRPNSISANLKNLNQFIIGFEKGFKIFDIRNFGVVEDWTDDLNCRIEKCIIDNNHILAQNELGIMLYDYKEKKKLGERLLKDKIGFFSFINYQNEETKIIYGDQIGNVFYSST